MEENANLTEEALRIALHSASGCPMRNETQFFKACSLINLAQRSASAQNMFSEILISYAIFRLPLPMRIVVHRQKLLRIEALF